MTVSTHILDAVAGCPAAGIAVTLSAAALSAADAAGSWLLVESAATDPDGRHRFAAATPPGVYRLVFATGPYFAARSVAAFYPEVTITFSASGEPGTHYHVPLLLSPFAYSTYRGT
jgi:5-hydroxyisourate hydrolase